MKPALTAPQDDSALVNLSADDLVGAGTRHKCYRYPGKPELCIKLPDRNKYGIKQQKREEKLYRSLERRGASTSRLARYHGHVETSLGRGYVFDAVRNPDGRYSRSFNETLQKGIGDACDYVAIMETLEDYLIGENVLFYDRKTSNVLCRSDGDGGFDPFIIDGLGDLVAISVLNFSD